MPSIGRFVQSQEIKPSRFSHRRTIWRMNLADELRSRQRLRLRRDGAIEGSVSV